MDRTGVEYAWHLWGSDLCQAWQNKRSKSRKERETCTWKQHTNTYLLSTLDLNWKREVRQVKWCTLLIPKLSRQRQADPLVQGQVYRVSSRATQRNLIFKNKNKQTKGSRVVWLQGWETPEGDTAQPMRTRSLTNMTIFTMHHLLQANCLRLRIIWADAENSGHNIHRLSQCKCRLMSVTKSRGNAFFSPWLSCRRGSPGQKETEPLALQSHSHRQQSTALEPCVSVWCLLYFIYIFYSNY